MEGGLSRDLVILHLPGNGRGFTTGETKGQQIKEAPSLPAPPGAEHCAGTLLDNFLSWESWVTSGMAAVTASAEGVTQLYQAPDRQICLCSNLMQKVHKRL